LQGLTAKKDKDKAKHNEEDLTMVSILVKLAQVVAGIVNRLLSNVKTPAKMLSLLLTSPKGSLASSTRLNSLSLTMAAWARRSCTI